MEILSKNLMVLEGLKNQKAWIIKFELKKNVDYSYQRFSTQIATEFSKIFPENVLSITEILMLYKEEMLFKKYEKYAEMIKVWQDVPKIEKTLENKNIKDYFFIECSAINQEGLEIKNNKM